MKESTRGFTLLELMVVLGIIAILATLSLASIGKLRAISQSAHCTNSLRQLGVATTLYLNDNNRTYFPFVKQTEEGRVWYFGMEPGFGGGAEGSRELDVTQGPLHPYVQSVGGIEVCPAFPYESALWKPKFKGASWGYGYNIALSNLHSLRLERPAKVIVFGDCAQVNTFQAPASPKKPMVEEFYMIEHTYATVHFRHGATANLLFADGHVEAMQPHPGTEDPRLPEANVGRITPKGSMEYLR
jgi:prepilin-type N-terminal cleavage/methylation domain-containing protein/prepilin-type processing-associated H-X9-DG protein